MIRYLAFPFIVLCLLTCNSLTGYCVHPFILSEQLQDTIPGKSTIKQPVYTTTRLTTSKPLIDGKLDDECWQKGNWAGDWHQYIPTEGATPTYRTEMNIQYDDKNIYVAFRAFDGEPKKMVRLAGVRDQFVGDIVGVNFDSYRDYRTGFEFNMTSWGQKVDLVLFNPSEIDLNWNPVWKGKTGVEDSAWVAEFEIPLSQLRYSNKDEQVWGIHTWRWISRLSEENNFERQSKNGPGMLYNFGEFRGIKGLKKSRRVEIMPFAFGQLNTMKEEPGNPFTANGRNWGGNMGLDAKIGLSSNFTVDLTVNPDFGQVEADPSVMNLSAFETFYREKRPFFLEGLTIFDYKFDDQSLFYSRRIGHAPSLSINPNENLFVKSPEKTTILSAIKLSGTTSKGLSVGLIQSLTANQSARLSDQDGNRSKVHVEPLTNYTVARVQKGFNEGNTVVGGIVTSVNRFINDPGLEFLSRNAYTGGLDLLHHWKDKEYFVETRLIGSHINGSREAITALQRSSAHYYQRPGANYLAFDTNRVNLNGFGGKLKIGKGSKGFWKYSTGVTWLSPGLELNDLGYMQSADMINQANEISYLINKPVFIFHSYDIGLEQSNSWNFNGTYLGSGAHLSFDSEFENNWTFGINLIYNTRAINTNMLRGGPEMILPYSLSSFGEIGTNPTKKIILEFGYDYEKRGNNSARSYQLSPGLSVRPFDILKIGVSANYAGNNDELQYVTTKSTTSGKRYILGAIDQKTLGLTFRIDLYLAPELSIQYYGSPFISKGNYSRLKYVTDSKANDYNERFAVYPDYSLSNGIYSLYDYEGGSRTDYSINNPDFNFYQFRSNLVAKWEYRLGSFIYFVWSSDRTGNSSNGTAPMSDSFRQLWKSYSNNIFLIKLSYWFGL
jgi:hypothetical protein